MSNNSKPSPQEDLYARINCVVQAKEHLEKEIQAISASASEEVAASSCWIVRYLAKGRKSVYWYYKLHASVAIFPTKTDGKSSRYKHLGKAGSQAYLDAVEQIFLKAKIEALDRSIKTLDQGLKDLIQETSKYNKD
ncbi:hypothetical protein [Nostoc sp. ChiSLP03a]|uniref:hypothetical protein n=1 Tax=Nostoc sp. ChiSLP03a TaxID=3075380 RepID=UPI002AD4F19D|nr:hypothetical protein [Nostoc sp. ChiSLP03a]MDZ8215682.1 hypothetical protein [Nostoc sp. ChiSLP03a]